MGKAKQKILNPDTIVGNEYAVILGYNVERLRRQNHITKVRFAMMLGIGRPTLDRIEDGVHDPRLSLLCQLADALDVDIFELLTPPARVYL